MERLEKCAKRSKMINYFFLSMLFCMGSCTLQTKDTHSFITTFEAYRWIGGSEQKQDQRMHKIMELLHNYDAESMTTGVEYIPGSGYTRTCNYIAFCTNSTFQHLNFIPIEKKHKGIAYICEVDEYFDGIMNDSLKLFFPDSIQAKSFVEESLKYGFKRYGGTYCDEITDSLYKIATQYATYRPADTITFSSTYVRVMSETDRNVVIMVCDHY